MVPGGLDGERQLLRTGLRQGAASRSQKRLVPVWLARERQLLHSLRGQPPYQADRPRCSRDIRGRVGLALDCRSGPGPRTARCRARSRAFEIGHTIGSGYRRMRRSRFHEGFFLGLIDHFVMAITAGQARSRYSRGA